MATFGGGCTVVDIKTAALSSQGISPLSISGTGDHQPDFIKARTKGLDLLRVLLAPTSIIVLVC